MAESLDEILARAAQTRVPRRSFLAASGQLTERRSAQQRRWLSSLVREALEAELWSNPGVQREAPGIEALVQSGAITPTEGARRLLATFRQR